MFRYDVYRIVGHLVPLDTLVVRDSLIDCMGMLIMDIRH